MENVDFLAPPRDWTDRLPGFKIVFAPTKIEEGKREKKETEFPRYLYVKRNTVGSTIRVCR